MKVGRRLRGELVTIAPDRSLNEAYRLMAAKGIRHLPVVMEGVLVGIVSDRDVKTALVRANNGDKNRGIFLLPPDVSVEEVMTRDPVVVTPASDVEEAARLMFRHKIGALPVVEGESIVGIITESDILGIFIEIMGVIESSSRVDVETDDSPDSLNRAAEVIRQSQGRIISVAMAAPRGSHRTYYFRLSSCDTAPIVAALEEAGFTVTGALG